MRGRSAFVAFLALATVASAGEDWHRPRGDLANTGVVRTTGPRSKPEVSWFRREEGTIGTGAALSGGLLVYGHGEYGFCCRRQSGGAAVWDKAVKQQVVAWPTILGPRAYVGGQDGVHYRIEMKNGNEPESLVAAGPILADPAVTERHYLAGSQDGFFYAMDPERGTLLWKVETGPVRHGAAVDRRCAYVANERGVLFALELKKGEEAWRFDGQAEPVAAPILSKSSVLLVLPGCVQEVSLKTGEALARHETPAIAGAPVLDGTRLHYGTAKGEVVTLDLKRSSETARVPVAEQAISTPLVLTRTGLYGAAGRILFAVDPKKRSLLWTHEADAWLAPPIVADKAVYVGAGEVFYCLR